MIEPSLQSRFRGSLLGQNAISPNLELLPIRIDVSKMLLRVTQHKDEKGEYDFDSTRIHLEIPNDL